MLRWADVAAGSGGFRRSVSQNARGELLCLRGRRSLRELPPALSRLPVSTASMAKGERLGARRRCSSASVVTFAAPPEELEDGYFERPTPILLVAGEGQSPDW